MAAGEAHWQNGIVERHIGTFREMLGKLFLEDVFEDADNQTTVDHVCESKNRVGSTLADPTRFVPESSFVGSIRGAEIRRYNPTRPIRATRAGQPQLDGSTTPQPGGTDEGLADIDPTR